MTSEQASMALQVERVFQDEADYDETMALLNAAIERQPDDSALYALRARLHGGAFDLLGQWSDLSRAVALAPDERDLALSLALLQHRRADRLAQLMVDEGGSGGEAEQADAAGQPDDTDDTEDDGFDWDLPEDPRVQERAEELGAGALAALRTLMRSHAADPLFVDALLAALPELPGLSPWTHYTLILTALAAQPDSIALLKHEARFLVALSSHVGVDSDDIPSGHFEGLYGVRYHALTVERAIGALEALLAIEPDPALLAALGQLLVALDEYPRAAQAYRDAAQGFAALLERASGDERDALAESHAGALKQAHLCSQGRAALVAAQLDDIDSAVTLLDALRPVHDADADDTDDPDDTEDAVDAADMDEAMHAMRAMSDALAAGPDAEQRVEIERLAGRVAAQTMRLIARDEIVLTPIAQSDLVGGLSPWFGALEPELAAAGLRLFAQFDNPSNTRALGMQCQGQLWTDPHGATALVLETVKTIRLRRLLTELSDGSMVITADGRASTPYQNGPRIDTLNADASIPTGELTTLHLARVARKLAATPGLRALPVDTLARLAELEERMRVLKNAFRIENGITEIEVRGMHVMFHDHFSASVKQAMALELAAYRAGR